MNLQEPLGGAPSSDLPHASSFTLQTNSYHVLDQLSVSSSRYRIRERLLDFVFGETWSAVVFMLGYLNCFLLISSLCNFCVGEIKQSSCVATSRPLVTIDMTGMRYFWDANLAIVSCSLLLLGNVLGWMYHLNLVSARLDFLYRKWGPCGYCKFMPALPAIFHGGRARLVPVDPARLLELFFAGQPQGTPMVSYCWSAGGRLPAASATDDMLPRRVARWFPQRWLDIEQLKPGSDITSTCAAAVNAAHLRIAFVNDAYLASKNCRTEWEQIRREPEKALVFVHASCGELGAIEREFASGGVVVVGDHSLFSMDPQSFDDVDLKAEKLLDLLIEFGHVERLFTIASPSINENWLPTVSKLLNRRGLKFLICLPTAAGLIVFSALLLWFDHAETYDLQFGHPVSACYSCSAIASRAPGCALLLTLLFFSSLRIAASASG